MKYLLLVITIMVLTACGSDEPAANQLEGNWKIYQVSYGGKDISKSSDPTNENGFWFDGNTNYRRFGNPGHRDTGAYKLDGDWLTFKSQQDSMEISALVDWEQQDTLKLLFSLENNDTLKMSLYKMAD
jgi:hypothetical protein